MHPGSDVAQAREFPATPGSDNFGRLSVAGRRSRSALRNHPSPIVVDANAGDDSSHSVSN